MNASPEPERRIEDFLEVGPTELPERVYDAVRSDIDTIRQRAVIGPWRTPDMNLFSKLSLVAAAAVLAAAIGIGFLPLASDPGAGAPVASMAPLPDPFASAGPLDVGTYRAEVDGVPVTFDVPAEGWQSGDFWIAKGDEEQPETAYVVFWGAAFDNVYSEPCPPHTPLSPAPESSAESLASAVARIPGTDLVTGPWSVTVGGRPAQHVAFAIREDIGCEPNQFYLWYDDDTGGPLGGYRYADSLGQTLRTWIVELDDRLFWVDSQTAAGADAVLSHEIQQIVESLRFE